MGIIGWKLTEIEIEDLREGKKSKEVVRNRNRGSKRGKEIKRSRKTSKEGG